MNTGKMYGKFSFAPIELKAFTLFVLVVTVLHLMVIFFLPREVYIFYIKRFGGITGNTYMFTLYFTFALIFHTTANRAIKLRQAILGLIFLIILFKFLMLIKMIDSVDGTGFSGFIWSIIIPVFWVVVLWYSPGMNRFCKSNTGMSDV